MFLYVPAAAGCASWAARSSPDPWSGCLAHLAGARLSSDEVAHGASVHRPPVTPAGRTEMRRQRGEPVSGERLALEARLAGSRICRAVMPNPSVTPAGPIPDSIGSH